MHCMNSNRRMLQIKQCQYDPLVFQSAHSLKLETDPGMFTDNTGFTNVHSMFKAEQICHFFLGTLAQAHGGMIHLGSPAKLHCKSTSNIIRQFQFSPNYPPTTQIQPSDLKAKNMFFYFHVHCLCTDMHRGELFL